jgi:hypothetical protein
MALRPQTTAAFVLNYLWLKASNGASQGVSLPKLAAELRLLQEKEPRVRLYNFPQDEPTECRQLSRDLRYLEDLRLVDNSSGNPSVRLTPLGFYFGGLFSAPSPLQKRVADFATGDHTDPGLGGTEHR